MQVWFEAKFYKFFTLTYTLASYTELPLRVSWMCT